MDYTRKNHSNYCMLVHLIFVTKYRKPLLIEYGGEIKHILKNIAKVSKGSISYKKLKLRGFRKTLLIERRYDNSSTTLKGVVVSLS